MFWSQVRDLNKTQENCLHLLEKFSLSQKRFNLYIIICNTKINSRLKILPYNNFKNKLSTIRYLPKTCCQFIPKLVFIHLFLCISSCLDVILFSGLFSTCLICFVVKMILMVREGSRMVISSCRYFSFGARDYLLFTAHC